MQINVHVYECPSKGIQVISCNEIVNCRQDLKWFEAWFEGKFDRCSNIHMRVQFIIDNVR